MKILKLKFKNINSLADLSEIDFTDPVFADNGIFAITGKTGAGKSSILDAVSLALFGKTPRIKITGENNDVMTRGAGDCFSEIAFEVNGKKWVSSWKQDRTRTGNLNPVSRQIADADGVIAADQVRGCDAKIVEILGLTFEQFTKVIMLAQGSFAAFLQADKNEKGELLEQITGTEIYGEISKKVFERNKTEKEKLDKIIVELGAIKILSPEEIENLNRETSELETQKKQIEDELQKIETAQKWLLDLSVLQNQIDEAKTALPTLEQNAQETKAALEQAELLLTKAKTEKENAEPVLNNVRGLDIKISETEKRLGAVFAAMYELEKAKKEVSQILGKQAGDLEKSQTALEEKQRWATLNFKYESLPENYAAIENIALQVAGFRKDFEMKREAFVAAKKDLEAKISECKKFQADLAEKENAINAITQNLETKKAELSVVLSGRELFDYQNEKENVKNFGTQIKNLIETEKSVGKNKKEIEDHKAQIAASEKTEKELSEKIEKNRETAENLEKHMTLLDENIKQAKTIQNFEEHRKSLEDGIPCPLCGATEHPYAYGNEPKIGEKEKELTNLKKKLQLMTNNVLQDEKTLAKSLSDKENSIKNKTKEESNLSENQAQQKSILAELAVLDPGFHIPESETTLLEEIHKLKQEEYKHINGVISKANEIEKFIKLQNEDIQQLQEAKQAAEKAKTESETAQKLAEQQIANKQSAQDEAKEKYREKQGELSQAFETYGVEKIETLKQCLIDWNANKKATGELEEQISGLEKELALKNSQKTENQKQLDAKTAEKQAIEEEKQKLSSIRQNLFGDKRIEDEEKRLKDSIEKKEASKKEAEIKNTAAATEFAKHQAVIIEKEKELAEKQTQNITEKTLDELQREHGEKKSQSDEISQKMGANRQSLIENEKNQKTSGKKIKEKEVQQDISGRWAILNKLIGSQDGKTYRNFAQALTFDHLIGLTNMQLQKMSERYILKRVGDASNPFELSVIDKFQNCEERTAQNLSGGEKFIVSLSLALGLANMASKNMKIDTMFIDEGFGTLDSDYLDVALSALSNLQNEGKLIGVISHLSELKERIATHIEVSPLGNGHSKIILPHRL